MKLVSRSKNFYFSIIDDTDDSTLENTKPIYDLLQKKGFRITKTVWVYPPRDKYSSGDSLQRPKYLEFIKDIKSKGFEIGLHNVGSGNFRRKEILKGLEEFKDKLGDYPSIHINHSYNPDSIYGGFKRFNQPFKSIVKKMYPQYSGVFQGEIEDSKYFWGDKHKEIIRFSRNHEFAGINTVKYDKYMPYIDPMRGEYSKYWFSSTFAPNPLVFKKVLNKKSINKLINETGVCIIFTHLGYFCQDGVIDKDFIKIINYLSEQNNGKYIPVSNILNDIALRRDEAGLEKYPTISRKTKFLLEYRHLITRFRFRHITKLDDYSYKNLNKDMFTQS